MKRNSPPALACWFLESLVPAPNREAMLGDLIEEYALRAESASPLTASRWFWSQVCRSVLAMVWSSLRSRDWLISMSIALGVYVVMEMLESAADLTISKWVAAEPTTHVVLAPVLFLTISAIGGYVVSRIRRGARVFLALIVMIAVAVSIHLKVCTIPVPWWYQFGFLTLGPLAVLTAPAIVGVLAPGDAHPAK
jgi:uncharacterized membrane protein